MARPKAKIPWYTNKQLIGIFALLLFMVIIQFAYFLYKSKNKMQPIELSYEDVQWLNHQNVWDSLQLENSESSYKIYPFNPNFITDFKGYQLGMSVAEIDRLHTFRETNKYVNSAREFQQVTKISDSLLNQISPYFKFPDWIEKNKNKTSNNSFVNYNKQKNNESIIVNDINNATIEDLISVRGIGETFATRIITERDKFNGFSSLEQLNDIWGLNPEAILNLKKHFKIIDTSQILKIKINDASVNEVAKLPYIRYNLAKDIVIYRSKFGDFKTITDLEKVTNFPSAKANIINNYIEF